MDIKPLHRWDLSEAEAVALQSELASRVEFRTPLPSFDTIAGCDISFDRGAVTVFAGVVVLKGKELTVVERCGFVGKTTFPYIPGLLSFREAPALLGAFARLKTRPDVVMLDGQGRAHPRRLGLASHVGLWLDVPCVGCAKSKLTGRFDEPDDAPGATSPLTYRGELIGRVVWSKKGTLPLFVSPGHRIDLDSAVRVVLETGRGYRMPEPTRLAHEYVNALRRGDVAC